MKKIINLILLITIIWLGFQNNGLKDSLYKKDEQINQLQAHAKEAETNQSKALDKLNHDFIYEFFSASTKKEKYEIGKAIMTDEVLQKLFPKNHKENHSYEGTSIEVKYLEFYTTSVSKEEEIYLNLITLNSKAAEEQKVIVKTIYILVDGNWMLKDVLIEG
ncbi:hypothetical protein NDK25_04950 [Niallia taxi]|nr:hypothetical protein [Niallia taxi]MDE5051761.1 hypothetical protein [Niallia taxi]